MPKHFVKTPRFIRAAMRLREEHEKRVATLRRALVDGEGSGEAVPFVMADVLAEARKEAGVSRFVGVG